VNIPERNNSQSLSAQSTLRNKDIIELSQPENRTPDFGDFLQSVIDASGSYIAILDDSRAILRVNKAWRQFASQFNLSDARNGTIARYPEICGRVLSSEAVATGIEGLQRIIENGEPEFQMAFPCCEAFKEPFWLLVHATAFRVPSEEAQLGILVSQYRIPPAKVASDALRNNEEFLRRFFTTSKLFQWEADPERRQFSYVGHLATEVLGYSLDEWLEPDFWISHIHADDRRRASAEYTKQMQAADQFQFEYRMIAKDGRIIWMHDIVNVQHKNRKPISVRGFLIDVAEQKPSEETLKHLSGRFITAGEEERKHIARELHDDLNQRVALISIELEQVGQDLASSKNVVERVKGIQKKIEEMSADIHRMSHQLHPSKLDHLGLAATLNGFCKEISESRGLAIHFRHDLMTGLPKDVELCLFRVAQEALQNAAKYSGASAVEVTLTRSDNGVKLVVSDNGVGFDATSESFTKGLGFISMKERLRLVGGELRITTKKSQGTQIEAVVPLAD
jgi:PAS domain S-box-containing protein